MNLKSYDCYKFAQITKNINNIDLKCKGSGHIHRTMVNIDFMNKIQKFIDDNGFDKIEIVKGFLCKDYIKRNKIDNDKYTKNGAIDIIFYKDDKVVSSKEICELAKKNGIIAKSVDDNVVYIEDGVLTIKKEEKNEEKNTIHKVEEIIKPKEEKIEETKEEEKDKEPNIEYHIAEETIKEEPKTPKPKKIRKEN